MTLDLRTEEKINELEERVKIFNEVFRLIASNVSLSKISKTLVNECAYLFSAKFCLCLVINEKETIEPINSFGCPVDFFPQKIPVKASDTIKQVLSFGGHFSIRDIEKKDDHFLKKISLLNIKNLEMCCLETKGEVFGVLILGYGSNEILKEELISKFDEFTQVFAVAILNAKNHERIAAYTNKLKKLVQERTKDLEMQTQKAEEANMAKSKFLSNMSHELRTPLTAIVGYANILNDGILGELQQEQKEAIDSICKSSDHLKILIDDVLNLARVESGKETANPQSFNLKSLLEESYNLVIQNARDKKISLLKPMLQKKIENISIYFDPKHFKQIMVNLLSNAIKYTHDSGTVEISAQESDEFIKISVKDSGVGISQERLPKLFERFERGEDEYSKNQVGTGIGLDLTKKLVELNGGQIGATSVLGEGSEFFFYAPISQENEKENENITKENFASKLTGLSILVIDNNIDSCKIMENILTSANAKVFTKNTFKNAIDDIEKLETDLIICDAKINDERGTSFIRQLKNENEELSKIPVLVVSASAFESDKKSLMEAGASGFMAKPFKPKNLVSTIRQLTFNRALE